MTSISDYAYRIFLCFAHKDSDIRNIVDKHLQSLGMEVGWSGSLLAGTRFADQIRDGISRAHLFIPILTTSASRRPWVHQEIGFALGMNIPVLPLAIGELPGGMAEELQAMSLDDSNSRLENELKTKLTRDKIEQLIGLQSSESKAVFQSAELHEDRTRMLYEAARRILQLGKRVKIRQAGALTSFSLPAKPQPDSFWDECDGDGPPRCPGLRRDAPKERYYLEQHAQVAGCDLIISPSIRLTVRGDQAKKLRLTILRDFLATMAQRPEVKVRAALVDGTSTFAGNTLFIGDLFMAESITPTPGFGYRQTLGTWHAPTILQRVEQFDREFEQLWNPTQTLANAIQRLEEFIAAL